jgi:flagellar biogenesis protein FliO
MKNIRALIIFTASMYFVPSVYGETSGTQTGNSKKTAMKALGEIANSNSTSNANSKVASKVGSKNTLKSAPEATLNTVETDADADMSRVTMVFSEAMNPAKVSLTEHGTFIQVEVTDTQAAKPGTFLESTSPYLKKIAIFQPDPSSSSVRIFADDALQVKQSIKMDIVENRVILTLNHKEYLAAGQPQIPLVNANPTSGASADPASNQASLQSAQDAKDKVAALSGVAPKTEKSVGLASNMRNASLFIAFMLVLAIAAFYMKGAIKNKRSAAAGGDVVTMKRLSSMALNAKQQLSLIEVGGEKLLLAVSNDSVSLITHIQKPDAPIKLSAPKSTASEIAGPSLRRALPSMETKSMDSRMSGEQPNLRKSTFQKNVELETEPALGTKGSKINIKIDDNGAKATSSDAIKDVTSMIRQKMKDLPKF